MIAVTNTNSRVLYVHADSLRDGAVKLTADARSLDSKIEALRAAGYVLLDRWLSTTSGGQFYALLQRRP